MNGVLGAAELFDASAMPTEHRDLLSIIKSSGQAMLVLIGDILDLSKIEAGKIELEEADVDIRECIESAIDVVAQKALAKGLDIVSRVSSAVPFFVRCDASRLKQILFNLLSNAVKVSLTSRFICLVPHRMRHPSANSLLSCCSNSFSSQFTHSGQVTLSVDATVIERCVLLSPTPAVAPERGAQLPCDCFSLRVEVADSGSVNMLSMMNAAVVLVNVSVRWCSC